MNNEYYDMIYGVSTYKSLELVQTFINSLKFLSGRNLVFITGPLLPELRDIEIPKMSNCRVIVQHTSINNHVMGRSWPFVWCVNNGVHSDFYVTCDDDLEFVKESSEILWKAIGSFREVPYAMLGFESNHPMHYPDYINYCGNIKIGVPWLDGNFIITRFYDNLRYGVMDALPDVPLSFFVETEYSHRFRFLTNRPIIVYSDKIYYLHHFRETSNQRSERSSRISSAESNGLRYWREKFGISALFSPASDIHTWLYKEETLKYNRDKFKSHLLFGGRWTNWKEIYKVYKDKFSIVKESI